MIRRRFAAARGYRWAATGGCVALGLLWNGTEPVRAQDYLLPQPAGPQPAASPYPSYPVYSTQPGGAAPAGNPAALQPLQPAMGAGVPIQQATLSAPEESVLRSTAVLQEIMAVPNAGIPGSLLQSAKAVAIVPNVLKVGFIVGGRHGRGVVLLRQPDGSWGGPQFVLLTGGSFGWQIGAQSTDVILVFRTPESVANLLKGKFTIGADAAVAAGPVGRQAQAATDLEFRAEILSYSRSRGLFAGVSLDGSSLRMDYRSQEDYYGRGPDGRALRFPQSGELLMAELTKYSKTPAQPGAAVGANPAGANPANPAAANAGAVGLPDPTAEAKAAGAALEGILDPQWRAYLAMPTEWTQGRDPSVGGVDEILKKFRTIAENPQYRELAGRPEFRRTYDALTLYRQYLASKPQPAPGSLSLPPPPGSR